VRAHASRAPEAITFERDYRGTIDQAQHVRADLAQVAASCPVLDDLVLLASELSTNAILHSRSGHSDRTFTVRVTLYPGDYAWGEVIDHGGTWTADEVDDEHGRGLAIVAAVAGDGNWGIDGDAASRAAWFRLDWHPNAEERYPSSAGGKLLPRTVSLGICTIRACHMA
jgi:two-component sensor histidine kinase